MILNENEGYFYQHSAMYKNGEEITLIPWGRVEGTVMVPQEDDKSTYVQMKPQQESDGMEQSRIDWRLSNVAHIDGQYGFSHVPSIPMNLGRMTSKGGKTELSHNTVIHPQPGETLTVNIGGEGQTVKRPTSATQAKCVTQQWFHRMDRSRWTACPRVTMN